MIDEEAYFFPRFIRKHLGTYITVLFWLWHKARTESTPYISLFYSSFLVFPFLEQNTPVLKYFITYMSFCLQLVTISLTALTPCTQIFIIQLHFEILKNLKAFSPYTLICTIMEVIIIFSYHSRSILFYGLLALNFLASSTIMLMISNHEDLFFSTFSSFLSSFISVVFFHQFDGILLLISIFLSLPKMITYKNPIGLETKHKKRLVYAGISFTLNIISFFYGVKYISLSVQSLSMFAICNAIAIFGNIISDITSAQPATSTFSYGFTRAKIISGFGFTILAMFSAFDLFSSSVMSLLSHRESTPPVRFIFFLSLIDWMSTVFFTFYLGHINIQTCKFDSSMGTLTIMFDLISSTSNFISALCSAFFNVNYLDPFVSLLIAAMWLGLSIPKSIKYSTILLQIAPSGMTPQRIIKKLNLIERAYVHVWQLNDVDGDIMTMKYDKPDDEFGFKIKNLVKGLGFAHSTIQPTIDV